MRVTMRGYSRDHGATILAEESLSDLQPEEAASNCPRNGAVLQPIRTNGSITEFKYRRRVPVNMNGEYAFEVTLTALDAAKLCWLAFRGEGLAAFIKLFGVFERRDSELEELAAEGRRLAEQRRERRRLAEQQAERAFRRV